MRRLLPIMKVLILFLIVPNSLYAYDFESGGIYYGFLNDGVNVSVTSGSTEYQGDIVIPSVVTYKDKSYNVTYISWDAFTGCHGLTSVTLPKSMRYIVDNAFLYCDNLTAVYISDLEAFMNINFYLGDYPSNPLFYAHHLYLNDEEIIDLVIPNLITRINSYAFINCSSLKSVTIPNSVTSIGTNAFWGCSGLTTIVSEIEKPFEIIDSYSFSNETYTNAELIVPKGTKAAYQATEGWNKFTNIVEAGDDSTISGQCGDKVYYSYDKTIHTLTIYGEGTMRNCFDVAGYPWWSFHDDIQHIIIEFGVTSIEREAFGGCSGLTSITLPKSLNYVNEYAFRNCNNLAAVYISDLEAYLKVNFMFDDNPSNPLFYAHHLFLNGEEIVDLVIPNGVTSIANYAFVNGSSLKSVYIPSSLEAFGVSAFNGCSSLTTIVSEIEKPYKIDNSVFNGIPSDAQLIVPKGTKVAYQSTEGWNRFTNIVEAGGTGPDQSGQIQINDIYYKLTESGEAEVVSAENRVTNITIPSTVSYNNTSYKVMSIAKDAFENCEQLSAVIWEPEVQFNAKVNNPNFLLYVSDEKYASRSVKNVVVNGVAESIELTDAANGNDFYCPRAFRARNIVYSHNYQMETGIGDSRGWETIVLPFDVQKYTHATKGELEPFTTWSKGGSKKPFWLFELTASGYKDVAGIKANTPYIISMPNNQQYEQQYQIPGIVTFSASDVEVQKSDNLKPGSYQGRSLVPNYMNKDGGECLPLNVNNYYVTNPGKDISGSKFVRGLRAVHPFEAYMITTDNTRSIDVMEGMTTAIRGIQMVKDEASVIKVYDTRGVLMKTATSMDDVWNGLKAGVYIVNGKKIVIK